MLTTDRRLLQYIGLRPTGDLGPLTAYTSKRGKVVWFLKSPPHGPPSVHQLRQRNTFRLVAKTWSQMTAGEREQWSLAERRAYLDITGYNLFVWYNTVGDDQIIKTIERKTNTNLIT